MTATIFETTDLSRWLIYGVNGDDHQARPQNIGEDDVTSTGPFGDTLTMVPADRSLYARSIDLPIMSLKRNQRHRFLNALCIRGTGFRRNPSTTGHPRRNAYHNCYS